jgi:hypothetical protein
MTVAQLIERLRQVINQEKEVTIWNPEWGITDPINDIDDRDDEIVLHT